MPACRGERLRGSLLASVALPITVLWLSPLFIMLAVVPVLFVNAYLPTWMPGTRARLRRVEEQRREYDRRKRVR